MPRTINVLGQTFGLLEVKRMTNVRSPRGGVLWECKCECGAIVYATAGDLRNGKKRSCGCKSRGPKEWLGKYQAATECVHCDGNKCKILTEMLCRTKYTCGFWAPKEDEEGRAER